MARYIGPVCRLCRREDMKLFLKGERCYTDKCGYERRSYPPGQHGQARRRKRSDYGEQLREKQKVKRIYGIAERQFRGYYFKASRMKGVTGDNLIQLLERRLDNVVYRMGFASDHAESRQLVRHGHFKVNGRRVNIASYRVKVGDMIEVKDKSKQMALVLEARALGERDVPDYIEVNESQMTAKLTRIPVLTDVPYAVMMEPHLVVEYYSR